ncbi:MAG: LuxR C-terminal-related transcriptional regulator [Anaerolineales bacterium]
MQAKETPPLLIHTKLNRPSLPADMVYRPRLTKWLTRHQRRPLTLISAPAGYGKSTLISCWLSSVDCPTAWVSLDEHDNQLGNFLSYFLAAIQTIFPNALPETQTLLLVTPQPSTTAIVHTIINELNQIGESFILVLDDYHLIESQAIHELLSELLTYPPQCFHLALSTRMDPPLPLIALRAKNQMTEIRIQDLRFTQEETQRLFQEMLGNSVDPGEIDKMNTQAEGWVTGLRLAALALRHRIGANAIQGELSAQNRYVSEYLFNEILAGQVAALSNCLLKTSILERFCADLCERICFPDEKRAGSRSAQSDFSGVHFLEWLQASNLFVIPLDDQRAWFRYHHLFQDFLQKQLTQRFDPDEIVEIHIAAGRWFAQNQLVEEALHHFLIAGDTTAAIELIARHRYRLMNEARWSVLDNWLNLFSEPVVEQSPELWMLKTWLGYHQGRWNELPAMIQRFETILADHPDPQQYGRLAGEIHAVRSVFLFYSGDLKNSVSQARLALNRIPSELWTVRNLARLHLGAGLLMLGDESASLQALYEAFEVEQIQTERFKAHILMFVCHIYWITADLQSMHQTAEQALSLCQELDFQQILGHTQRLNGFVHYQRGNLSVAEEFFGRVVARPYQNFGGCYANCVCGLSMTYQAQGKEVEARQVVAEAIAFLLKAGNTTQLPLIRALQAEIALQQGDLPAASQWAEKLDLLLPVVPFHRFLEPHLTLAKVWLVQNTRASQEKAGELLTRLHTYLTETHNTRFLIDTLALQALLADANGDQEAALNLLESSLKMAQPGGFIRVFVDLGPQMAALLSRMKPDPRWSEYIAQILAVFPAQQLPTEAQSVERPSVSHHLVEPLTNRELQVLKLLREHLTNKEIAAQLVISPGTVKGHTIRIYQKLDVKGRYQAVEKAVTLRILDSR